MKTGFHIIFCCVLLHFFFSDTVSLCFKSFQTTSVTSGNPYFPVEENSNTEEQKEDTGKEQSLFCEFSFETLYMLRPFIRPSYPPAISPLLAYFAEVADQPPTY